MSSEKPATTPAPTSSVPPDPSMASLFDIVHVPCFRESQLTSLWVGAAWGGFHYLRNRNSVKAANVAVYAWAAMSAFSWSLCRWRYRERREKIRDAVKAMNSTENKKLVVVQNLPGDDLVETVTKQQNDRKTQQQGSSS
jgi:hypothetical protein